MIATVLLYFRDDGYTKNILVREVARYFLAK